MNDIDPATAVDRALAPRERARFTGRIPADMTPGRFLAAQVVVDRARIEMWWQANDGDGLVAIVAPRMRLPTGLVTAIAQCAIVAAAYAGYGGPHLVASGARDTLVRDLLWRAALWARGYAEGAGLLADGGP